ncbi:hypothetical protein LTR56_022976 [Elasticomyces elasticus]|nr:hypothetical protein LTR56_022976 [Elasticomyces elasticus]KAK4907404.1 hypothetical protein LTR49_023587 [Elasticomyces elasticus]
MAENAREEGMAKKAKKANAVQKPDISKATKTDKGSEKMKKQGNEKIKKQERIDNKRKKTRKAERGTTALLQSMCIA